MSVEVFCCVVRVSSFALGRCSFSSPRKKLCATVFVSVRPSSLPPLLSSGQGGRFTPSIEAAEATQRLRFPPKPVSRFSPIIGSPGSRNLERSSAPLRFPPNHALPGPNGSETGLLSMGSRKDGAGLPSG